MSSISATALYKSLQKTPETTQVANFMKSHADVKAQVDKFRKDVANFKNPDDLFKNYSDLNFILTAFGQTSEISNIGLLKRILKSDPSNSKSLVNQYNNGSLATLTKTLQTDGSINASLQDKTVQDKIVNAFELASYEANLAQTSPAVPQAINFSHLIGSVKSIYDIMGNSTLRAVVAKVGNIPDQVVNQTLDAQGAAFAKVFDVKKVNDANYVNKFINRFLALSDLAAASSSSSASSNPALSILQSVASGSGSSGGLVSLDVGSFINYRT